MFTPYYWPELLLAALFRITLTLHSMAWRRFSSLIGLTNPLKTSSCLASFGVGILVYLAASRPEREEREGITTAVTSGLRWRG